MGKKIRCFICWLKGHQWHLRGQYYEKDGELWWRTTYFDLDHCARCGEPSPAKGPALTGEVE